MNPETTPEPEVPETPPTLNDHLTNPEPPLQASPPAGQPVINPASTGSANMVQSTGANRKKSGFGVLNIILIIITLIAIGIAVYYGVYHQKTVTKTTTVIVKVTPSPSVSPSPSASTIAADQTAALSSVKTFYNAYLATVPPTGSTNGTAYLATAVQRGLLTQAAVSMINSTKANQGYNLPTCSQNPLAYSAYAFSTPTITESTATMTITGTYAGPPTQATTIDLALQKVGSNWAINSITCPGK